MATNTKKNCSKLNITKSSETNSEGSDTKENQPYKTVKQLSYGKPNIDKSSCKRFSKPLATEIIDRSKENETLFKSTSKVVKTKQVDESPIISDVYDLTKSKHYVEFTNVHYDEQKNKIPEEPLSLKPNTSVRIQKQMEQVKALTLDDVEDCRKTYEDKVTRQVNFPIEKKLYKNLIPLAKTEKKKPLTISSNYEFSVREKEPKLEEYFTPQSSNEYAATAKISLPVTSSVKQYDGLNMHKRMISWNGPVVIVKLDRYLEK